MRRLRIKEGVSLAGLRPEMRTALIWADKVWNQHGEELCVTCHMEGEHGVGSLHYSGYALDLRTRNFGKTEAKIVADKLRESLPEGYDVVLESNHIHVEYDAIKKEWADARMA